MNTDIIVIQYLLQNGLDDMNCLDGYYSSIMLEDLQLEQVLQKGVAETHIHQGASMSFSVSWQHLMNLIKYGKNKKGQYEEEFLSNPYIERKELRPTVKTMALLRLLFILYLSRNQAEGFQEFLERVYENEECQYVNRNLLQDLIQDITDGKLIHMEQEDEYLLKNEWERIVQKLIPADIHQSEFDDIAELVYHNHTIPRSINTSGENLFLFQALRYLEGEGKRELEFQRLFWQYIRIKNQVFEAKVEFNAIAGLDYFQKYYQRSTQMEWYSNEDYWRTLIRNQLQNPHLRKLELRCSVPSEKSDGKMRLGLKKKVKNFLTVYRDILEHETEDETLPPQIGFVFHLIKTKDEEGIDKCWQNYFEDMPQSEKSKELYYRSNQHLYERQVRCLTQLRDSIPNLDKYLLGIDAASIENNTEPWVFAHAYQIARDSKTSKIQVGKHKLQTLGFTFHVGEDFRHLLTGLRHIDEVITHFGYHAGDRIGHGIALGADVAYWVSHNPIVLLPREEYLDNLLWVWGLCKDTRNHLNLDISYLEQLIMKQAEAVFRVIDGITVYILWKIYQEKFQVFTPEERYLFTADVTEQAKMGEKQGAAIFCKYAPDSKELKSWNYDMLRYVWHCRCYRERLEEIIQVEVTPQNTSMMKMLQKNLIEKISNQGIVVETNPTSNLAIGEIPDLFHHYILSLNEISTAPEHNSIIVSINSDDPCVFNTNVSNEIAYIFYALQQQGYSREEALLWIDKVRGYGMNTSFIKDRNWNRQQMINEINEILNQIG